MISLNFFLTQGSSKAHLSQIIFFGDPNRHCENNCKKVEIILKKLLALYSFLSEGPVTFLCLKVRMKRTEASPCLGQQARHLLAHLTLPLCASLYNNYR